MTSRERGFVALLFGASLALASCEGRPRSGTSGSGSSTRGFFTAATGKIVAIDLSDGAPESSGGGFFPLPASRTYVGLVRVLERAKDDQDAKGVYLRLGSEGLGWAQSEELGRLLGAIRDRGKPIVCHADSISNATSWLLARGCERIWLSPAGDADTVGIAAQLVHVKGALDKLEVQADFVHVGKFKRPARRRAERCCSRSRAFAKTGWMVPPLPASKPAFERRSSMGRGAPKRPRRAAWWTK
jgi:protease IV